MELLSVAARLAGVIDAALQTTSDLIAHARDTKHVSPDRRLLSKETLFLSRLLQRLRDRARMVRHDKAWLSDHKDIVRQFEAAYDDLVMTLKYDAVSGHIREESKPKAARTAANQSFSKSEVYSLLERVTQLQQHTKILVTDDQRTLLNPTDQKQQEALDKRLKTSVLSWLSPLPTFQTHQTFSNRPEKGSGKWFLADPAFKQWKENAGTRLWCWGKPGAGKTFMASIILNHLRQSRPEGSKGRIGIMFIYLRYNETEQTIDNILSSFLKQLLQESENIPPDLLGLYERHRDRNTPPTIDEISQALYTMNESHEKVYCVIDALDECSVQLQCELVGRLESLGPKLRVLITSQFLDSIAAELDNYQRFEIRANKADIELFIEHQIRRNKNLRKTVERSSSLLNDIKEGVFNTAENMFLLARLHVESLASAAGLSVKQIRDRLRTLPTTLKGAYDDAMERIEHQEPDRRRIALKVMTWVCCAFRALSLKELQHALAVEPGDTVLDEDMVLDGPSITSLCAGLVVVDQRTNIVNLVHYSTRSYFDDIRHGQIPEFHANITLVGATYLTLDSLKGARLWELVQDYPLACYAAQFMGDHARNSAEEALEPTILEMIRNFLSHPDKRKQLLSLLDSLDLIQAGFYSKNKPMTREKTEALVDASIETELPTLFDGVLGIAHSDTSSTRSSVTTTDSDAEYVFGDRGEGEEVWETKIKTSRIPEVTALHLAASIGLAKIASLLLKETINIDAIDETGETALALLFERGIEKAVEFLVNSGAYVDLRHERGRGVLLLMTERGWHNAGDKVVEKARLTAEKEVPGLAQDRTHFLLAAYEDNVGEAMRLAAQDELQLQSKDRDISAAALLLAVEKESVQMVETLVSLGIGINSKDDLGQTALHRATRRKNEGMLKLLLKMDANVDCKDDDNRTPWSANLRCENASVLQILLDSGANPSICGQQGVSELYTAAKEGDTEIVRYMLKSGTNPAIQTKYGWAPLHWAASYGHTECVKLLLEAGVEPSTVSDQRVTPLDLAMQADQSTVIELLHSVGAKLYQDIEPNAGLGTNELEKDGSSASFHSSNRPLATFDKVRLGPDLEKLRLCYDKPLARTLVNPAAVGQYVYPSGTNGAVDNIYEVSHFLETPSTTINIRRSRTRPEMWEYTRSERPFDSDGILYEAIKVQPDYQEFELCGCQHNLFAGTMTMHKDWTGGRKIRHNIEGNSKPYLLRTTPEWSKNKEEDSRWTVEDGTLQARSGWDDATPWICFELNIERQMQDLIVVCWVVKLWSETAALQKRDQ